MLREKQNELEQKEMHSLVKAVDNELQKDKKIQMLQTQNEQMMKDNANLCATNFKLLKQNVALVAEVAKLKRKISQQQTTTKKICQQEVNNQCEHGDTSFQARCQFPLCNDVKGTKSGFCANHSKAYKTFCTSHANRES